MKTVRVSLASAAVLAALACGSAASAATTTIALPDLLPYAPALTIKNLGQTYTGDGFVGLRSTGEFFHLYGIEFQAPYATKGLAQADISAFSGATINSATLSFVFRDGVRDYGMKATGFAGTGSVGYQFNAPAVTLGSVIGDVGPGPGSLDVTAIVAAAVAAHTTWLDLLTEGLGCCEFTWTQDVAPAVGRTADTALVRLTVDYAPAGPVGGAVPEPSTWAMLNLGFAGLGAAMRARRPRTAVAG